VLFLTNAASENLSREKHHGAGEVVQTPIVLGCGREQTGAFLDGLMGLGSVPSLPARSCTPTFLVPFLSRSKEFQ
jgi:hypothetical protein